MKIPTFFKIEKKPVIGDGLHILVHSSGRVINSMEMNSEAIAFHPMKEWPKFFKNLPLYS